MPTYIDLDPAIFNWEARHGRRITHEELAELANISIASFYRLKSSTSEKNSHVDLRKINAICKVLECQPGDIIIKD